MKKKIALLSLLAVGATAVTLTSCGGSNNDEQVKQNQTNITNVQKEVKTLEDSLNSTKSALEEAIAKLNTYLSIEKITTNGDAIASLEAKIQQLQKSSDDSIAKEVKALSDALALKVAKTDYDEAIASINDTVLTLATHTELTSAIATINENMEALASDEDLAEAVKTINDTIVTLAKDADLTAAVKTINETVSTLATKTELESAIKTVSDAVTALDNKAATKEALEAAVKTINETVATLATKAELEAAVKTINETTATLATKTELESAIKTVSDAITALDNKAATKTELESAIKTVSDAVTALDNKAATKEALEAAVKTINETVATLATKTELETAVKNLEDKLATKADLNAAIDRIKAIEDSLKTDYVKVEDYTKAITELTAIDSEIKLSMGTVLKDETGKVISLQDQISDLEKAKATVEKLQELEKKLDDKVLIFTEQINNIQAEIGEIAKNDDEEIISLQDQINTINEKIGSIDLDENGEFISLQTQIDEIKSQIGDFSSSKELKDAKSDLVFELTMFYSEFEDEMDDMENELSNYLTPIEINTLFTPIQREFDHEMRGYLYKGITQIILSANEDEALKAKNEYEILLRNYIYPALFQLSQQSNLAYIDALSDAINIKSGEKEYDRTIREKYVAEINAVKWFTETELEQYELTEEDSEDEKMEKAAAYKEATDAKIAQIEAAYAVVMNIDGFLTNYNNAVTQINTDLAGDEISDPHKDAREAFIALLNSSDIYHLDEYYKCKNVDIKVDVFNPTTQTYDKVEVLDIIHRKSLDDEAIELVLQEATDYLELYKYIDEQYTKVSSSIKNVADKITNKESELVTFKNDLFKNADYNNYATLESTIDKSAAQLKADKEKVDLNILQVKAYNESLTNALNAKASIALLSYIPYAEENNEIVKINALIDGVSNYKDYINVLVEAIPTDSTDETLKTIEAKKTEDKAVFDLYVSKATAYNSAIKYANEKAEFVSGKDKNEKLNYQYITDTEKDTIKGKITAIPQYDNYITAELVMARAADATTPKLVSEQLDGDKAAIDLLISQATSYDTVLGKANALARRIKDYLLKIPNTDEAPERESIVKLVKAIPVYANYIENADYQKNETANTAEIALYEAKAKEYNKILSDASKLVEYITGIKEDSDPEEYNLAFVSNEDKEKIVAAINAIPKYANYITANLVIDREKDATTPMLVSEQYGKDFAALSLIRDQADAYDDNLEFADETKAGVKALTNIVEKEITEINKLIDAIVKYESYIGNEKYTEKKNSDYDAIDLYSEKADAYDGIIAYAKLQIAKVGTIFNVDHIEIDAENKTITDLITAIPQYANYITADLVIKNAEGIENPKKTIEDQFNADKASIDLLVTRATVFRNIFDAVDALNKYITEKTTVKEGENGINLFTDELKAKFKAEYADYAVATKYDEAIKLFTTTEAFTLYEELITDNEDGSLTLIKKNVDTFADILVDVNTATAKIEAYTNLSQNYKDAFETNFLDYATYETNNENTNSEQNKFDELSDFDTYYNNTKIFIDNVLAVAEYEDKLIAKFNSVLDNIDAAKTAGKITSDVADYLALIAADIYDTDTSVTEDANKKLVTKTTIEATAYATAEAKLKAVDDAITTFYNIDVAIKNLSSKLYTYKDAQESNFLGVNYLFRDDEKYAAAEDYNKYGGYNQAALTAWNKYLPDFDKEIDGIKYSYTVPTEATDFTYDNFTTYMASLLTPEVIGNRYNQIELWYEENTEEKPKAGMYYTITAYYEKLDAENVPGCRTYFINLLGTYKDVNVALTSSTEYKAKLLNTYNNYVKMLNNDYGVTTTSLIMTYESGINQLNTILLEATMKYKASKLTDLETLANTYKTTYPLQEENISITYKTYVEKINATDVDTESEIDAIYNDAVKAFEEYDKID